MEDWSASKKKSKIKTARLAGLPDEATASGPLSKTSLLAEDGCSLRNDDRPLLVFSEREQNESLYVFSTFIHNKINYLWPGSQCSACALNCHQKLRRLLIRPRCCDCCLNPSLTMTSSFQGLKLL